MYLEYFKLNEAPFSLTPDPRYLFMSARHREGLAHLLYGVKQAGGFVQLTGEVGSGKTTLSRCLINQLPDDADVALILNPRLDAVELLDEICDELKIPRPPGSEAAQSIKVRIDALNAYLLDAHARGRRTILIIDEAQNLDIDVLEQVRLLTNLETEQEKLLQIILLGQPELLALLRSERLRQLSQRITARYHLEPLSRYETHAYVRHRLEVAGRKEPLFTDSALHCVYRLSGGVPRLVNVICDRALLGAYAGGRQVIDAATVRKAGRETCGDDLPSEGRRKHWIIGAAVVLVAALVAVGLLNPRVRATLSSVVSGGAPAAVQGGRGAQGAVPAAARDDADGAGGRGGGASLMESLSDIPAGDVPAFAAVYSLWGFDIPADSSGAGCDLGRLQGFECLSFSGGWPRLRRYDLPAVLEFPLGDGSRRQVAATRLDGDAVRLVVRGEAREFPITEVDQVWEGVFVLPWKPPVGAGVVALGSSGTAVLWVRRALDKLEGGAENTNAFGKYSDKFDGDLQRRVMEFQRRVALVPDGVVGRETLIKMATALDDADAPSLSRGVRAQAPRGR
ncbi:MAG: AAA family ATPase [Acidobacteriota bacterium]|jgi:general secretion pathway protein A|nr:AAA family ATPase [Acidobacteriota bacterium]